MLPRGWWIIWVLVLASCGHAGSDPERQSGRETSASTSTGTTAATEGSETAPSSTAIGSGEEARVAEGIRLFHERGCFACHGSSMAPSMRGLAGTTREFSDGSTLTFSSDAVLESYLHESIVEPSRRIVGSSPPIMPVITLTDPERESLVVYIRCLSSCEDACRPACDDNASNGVPFE